MKGPRPYPTALHVLRGNPSHKSRGQAQLSGRLNEHEPQHLPLAPECPDELVDPVARAEWDRLAKMLIDRGQVTVVDRAIFIGYCAKYAQWRALEAEAAKHPFIVKAPSGYPVPNPALSMANKAFSLMLKACAELGITPSSRSRIIAQPVAPAASKWADVR